MNMIKEFGLLIRDGAVMLLWAGTLILLAALYLSYRSDIIQ